MRRFRFVPVLLLAAAFARGADALPSMEELTQKLEAKDYPAVLAGSVRILQLKGPATAGYHRSAVWMLKGEALARSSQFMPSAQAFDAGSTEKDAADDERDLCTATAALMRKSDRKGYQSVATRQRPSPQVYDVLDPLKRPEAIAALFGVELEDVTAKVARLKTAPAAGAVTAMVKHIAELRPMERVVEKNADKLDALEKTLAQNFVDITAAWADASKTRLDALATSSQQQVITRYTDTKGLPRQRVSLKGLTGPEQQEIRALMKEAQSRAAAEQQIAKPMTEAGKGVLMPSEARIQGVYDQAQSVLRTALTPAAPAGR